LLQSPYPLLAILLVQAALSLRLIWSNTAYPDEALYLSAGHLEWAHWLDGASIPNFPTQFSGAPTVYPPIGALADSLGGLAAARLLSLVFMLLATVLVYDVTRRTFGRPACIYSAGLFASTGACQYLGAFATYDAMALMLLALATWIVVVAAGKIRPVSFPLLILAMLVVAVADASKYAAALFDPVIIASAVILSWRYGRWRRAAETAALCLGVLGLVVVEAARVGGQSFWTGITFTTLTRATGNSTIFAVWWLTLGWIGLVLFLGFIGAVAALVVRDRTVGYFAVVVAMAGLLASADQARIHTITSLFKHVGFGVWFTSIVAGFALAQFARAVSRNKIHAATRVSLALLVCAFFVGTSLAWNQFHQWPGSKPLVSDLRRILPNAPAGPVLVGDNGYFAYYYLRGDTAGHQFWSAGFAQYSALLTNQDMPHEYPEIQSIKNGYFSVIVLSFHDRTWIDRFTLAQIRRFGGYRLAVVLPYELNHGRYEIWIRTTGGAR
jgi:4-amino-4-deoxy-L-arabinose transferase-like glycosyltransferase